MIKSTSWIAVTIQTIPDLHEAIENFLFELGSTGIHIQESDLVGYFDESVRTDEICRRLDVYFDALHHIHSTRPVYRFTRVPFEDWQAKWRTYFRPVRVSERLVVKPPWAVLSQKAGRTVIDIHPALAFGTGTHETTRLCLQLIDDRVLPQDRVLDAGTGSGILSIAAVKLGARNAVAFDIDADALMNARENCSINGVAGAVHLFCGSLESIRKNPYDMIVANINRRILETMVPGLAAYAHSGTRFILSGLLEEEQDPMESLFSVTGWEIITKKKEGEWVGWLLKYAAEKE